MISFLIARGEAVSYMGAFGWEMGLGVAFWEKNRPEKTSLSPLLLCHTRARICSDFLIDYVAHPHIASFALNPPPSGGVVRV